MPGRIYRLSLQCVSVDSNSTFPSMVSLTVLSPGATFAEYPHVAFDTGGNAGPVSGSAPHFPELTPSTQQSAVQPGEPGQFQYAGTVHTMSIWVPANPTQPLPAAFPTSAANLINDDYMCPLVGVSAKLLQSVLRKEITDGDTANCRLSWHCLSL